jgi:hypothetical protein
MDFVLTQSEKLVLDHIAEVLQFGYVVAFPQNKRSNAFHRYFVKDKQSLLMLAHLFNGNLALTHRINQLSKWFKIIPELTNYFIGTPVNITLRDAWLSGFTDAEGTFNVLITKDSDYRTGYAVKTRFILDQNDEAILNKIKTLFNFGTVRLRKETNSTYRYESSGFNNMLIVSKYFNKYTLRTKKSLAFSK